MPSLRSELRLNYTLGGFVPATLALGFILSGLFGDWFARLWSRCMVFWIGDLGLIVDSKNKNLQPLKCEPP